MEIVTIWAIFGLMIGTISLLFLERRNDTWIVWNIVLAITGALAGGMIATFFFSVEFVGFTLSSIFLVIFGSVITVLIAHTLYKTSKTKDKFVKEGGENNGR